MLCVGRDGGAQRRQGDVAFLNAQDLCSWQGGPASDLLPRKDKQMKTRRLLRRRLGKSSQEVGLLIWFLREKREPTKVERKRVLEICKDPDLVSLLVL